MIAMSIFGFPAMLDDEARAGQVTAHDAGFP
jgi:hypothetical protein